MIQTQLGQGQTLASLTYIYLYTYTYIYIHTYIHTHTPHSLSLSHSYYIYVHTPNTVGAGTHPVSLDIRGEFARISAGAERGGVRRRRIVCMEGW